MTVKSIDTRYAGCRFRSRLEARWAVFFNELGIAWEYEPQGFQVTERLTGGTWGIDDPTFNYLPDFWLPDHQVWAEVKGSLTRDEAIRLLNAAASLSSNDGDGCGTGNDLVVFGPLTNVIFPGAPIRLHMHKGDLYGTCFWCAPHPGLDILGNDIGEIRPDAATLLLRGFYCRTHDPARNPHIDLAYAAARSARFEWAGGRRR